MVFVTLPLGTGPDGIVFGASGTLLQGFAFSNDNDGTIYQIPLANPTQFTLIASTSPRLGGDFAWVDAQGNMLLIQQGGVNGNHLTRLSTTFGGQWAPGSTLCGGLHCAAQAATTTQEGQDGPCLPGLDGKVLITLSQAVCGCGDCATLNQARSTLIDFLKSFGPPPNCLDPLKTAIQALYLTCPCDPNPLACVSPIPCMPYPDCAIGKLSGGTCLAQTKFPLGIDLESYDPIMQPFIRRGSP